MPKTSPGKIMEHLDARVGHGADTDAFIKPLLRTFGVQSASLHRTDRNIPVRHTAGGQFTPRDAVNVASYLLLAYRQHSPCVAGAAVGVRCPNGWRPV
ncbi:MAG: hypothetical protein FKY71_11675 [Spiribacter salinus]|uniref:Uncharacterized protein n=1 Tax=Spiribacter salinus TaxID=1335746 RepID=A0A540VQ06_9GAMM|nr:MAG: hypothetical protein FKY71_11675 [Spiribacter salinus]